jgi:predicted ATPase
MARRLSNDPGPYLRRLEMRRDWIPNPAEFPYNLPAIRHLDTLPFHPKVTFLIGENGTGKSTLLEAIAMSCGLNPEGGSRNFNFATRESHTLLHRCLQIAKAPILPQDSYFLRAESFYNVATEIERLDREGGGAPIIGAYGGKSLHEQSHGESFFSLFQNRFRDRGLYLMDEPEAALSPSRQLAFLGILHDYCNRGCQFVMATHSPIIMAYPDARIFLLDSAGINEVAYTETEHYRVTLGFLSNPQRSLEILLADE